MKQEWKPNKKQAKFLELPDSITEALYGGAAGGGKTETLLMLPIAKKFYLHPRFKGILFRRTYKELEDEVIPRSKFFFEPLGAKYSGDKYRWTFPSGALMTFGHMQYQEDMRKYDSAEYNYIAWDELTSFFESMYIYLFTRCRTSIKGLPAIVRAGTNPGNLGHAWVKKRFVDPAPWGTVIKDKVTNNLRIFIQSKLEDNDHIDPNYRDKLMMLPEKERLAKLEGHWDTFEGQVFEEFRDFLRPDEPDNALHVIEPFDIPSWWVRVLAIDWGYTANTVAYWFALSPQGRAYCYREYSCSKTRISTWATEVKNLSRGEKFSDVVLCQSAWQDRGQDQLIADEFFKYSDLVPRKADNDRIAGKLKIQEYLRWQTKPASKVIANTAFDPLYADRLVRNQGIDAYHDYLASFEPEKPEENLPKLQIFNTCQGLINAIPKCIYADKDRVTGKPAEDVREFEGDDFYDAFRYGVMAIDAARPSSIVEENHYQQLNKTLEHFRNTGDYNYLHRNMEKLERENTSGILAAKPRSVHMRYR